MLITRTHLNRRFVFGAFAAIAMVMSAQAQSVQGEVPVANRVSSNVVNYHKLKPQIATAGLLMNGAVGELKALGFTSILDLRGPAEGTEIEKQAATAAGLRYFNVPVTNGLPSEAQIAEFGRLVEDPANYPIIVHCASGNRVGAMWALYRAHKGAPVSVALEEGHTAGLRPDVADGHPKAARGGGSGTTLIAVERTGRQAELIEFDPKCAVVILQRGHEQTGRTAIRQQSGKVLGI